MTESWKAFLICKIKIFVGIFVRTSDSVLCSSVLTRGVIYKKMDNLFFKSDFSIKLLVGGKNFGYFLILPKIISIVDCQNKIFSLQKITKIYLIQF